MSEDSSDLLHKGNARHSRLPWGPLAGLLMVLFSFLIVQQVASIIVVLLPRLWGWDSVRADEWIVSSSVSTFVYVVLAEAMTVGALMWFARYKKVSFWEAVGLTRRPAWHDGAWAVGGYVGYFLLFVAAVAVVQLIAPINIEQQQALGFERDAAGPALAMAFISLVILPPLVEEIVFRGFLYGTLRSSKVRALSATIITSLLFAALHLFGSEDGALLWIAFVDTFALSLVLCYVRERTGVIWASIGLHAIKNAIVFLNLFIISAS